MNVIKPCTPEPTTPGALPLESGWVVPAWATDFVDAAMRGEQCVLLMPRQSGRGLVDAWIREHAAQSG